jgi:hypothetical protein
MPVEVQLEYPEGWQEFIASGGELAKFSQLRSAGFRLPVGEARDLKVWAHRVSREGETEGLPAMLEIQRGDNVEQFDLMLSRGRVLIPVRRDRNEPVYAVRLIFPEKAPS